MNRQLHALLQFAPLSLFATYAFWDGAPTPDRWVEAFKLGAVAALVQLAFLWTQPQPANRLVLGANVYLLVAGAAAFAQQWWVLRIYDTLREAGILLAMLGVGLVATVATRAGFVAVPDAPADAIRRASLWLLGATLLAVAVAFVFRGERTFAAALPILGLAVLQRALVSRLRGDGMASERLAGVVLGVVLITLGAPHPAAPQTADPVTEARQALDAGRVDDALAMLEKAVAADAKNPTALAWLGGAQIRKARAVGGFGALSWIKRGFGTLDEAVERFPTAFVVYLLRGINGAQVPDMFRKAPAAVKDLNVVVAMKDKEATAVPDTVMPLVYLNLGLAHKKTGQAEEARAAWEKARRLYPGAPEIPAIDKELKGL